MATSLLADFQEGPMTRTATKSTQIGMDSDPGRSAIAARMSRISPKAGVTIAARRSVHRGVLRALGLTAVVLSALIVSPSTANAIGNDPVSTAPTPKYVRHATTNSNPVDLPGGALNLSLVQGEGVWLYTKNLEASTTWQTGPDPGVAFVLQCYGPAIASQGTGWYVARNLDPPHNTYTFRPQVRAMFVAPSSGNYTCKIRVAAYQPDSSITIPVTFHAGATLHATPIKPTSSLGVTAGYGWTVPNSGSNPQPVISATNPTRRHNYGNYTFKSSSSPKVTIILDQNVTTCAPGDAFPGCERATSRGTRVNTTLVVQPQHLDGTPCGVAQPLKVFTHTMTVITPYHHYPILNTAVLDKETSLFGCHRVNIALDLTWLSGEPMVIHTFRPNDERPGWGGIYEHR